MKLQKTIAAIVLLLLSNISFAQWNIVSSPDLKELNDVFLVNENTGWIIGEEGYLLYSSDGGYTWTEKNSGTDKDLMEIFFLDEQNGWIGTGENSPGGSVLKTTDGGETWEEIDFSYVKPNLSFELFDGIQFVDENTGFIVAGKLNSNFILKTTDGGLTWEAKDSLISVGTQYHRWTDINFYDGFRGVVVGRQKDKIKYTVDGGETWNFSNPIQDGFFNNLHKAFWIDETTIIAIGEGREYWNIPTPVYRSTDYGQNWEVLTESPAKSYYRVSDVYMKDPQNIIAIGSNGFNHAFTYKSTDSGETWAEETPSYPYKFVSVSGVNNKLCVVAESNHILISEDFGVSWTLLKSKPGSPVQAIEFIDGVGYAVTRSSDLLFNSNDGYSEWEYLSCVHAPTSALMHFSDKETGVILKDNKHLSKTTDGGSTWTDVIDYNLFNARNQGLALAFPTELTGYALMSVDEYSDYYLFKTTDGGDNWNPIKYFSGPSSFAGGMIFFDELNGFIFGPDTWVMKTTDGGSTWEEIELPGIIESLKGRDYQDVAITGPSTAWAVGHGLMFKTEDKGNTWSKFNHNITTVADSAFWTIAINTDGKGYIGCYHGEVLITEDNGDTWTVDDTFASDEYNFCEIALNSEGKVFLGTLSGHIIAWDVTVGVDDSPVNTAPDGYALQQNYPNPFNPSTNIVYDLKDAGNVKITVYDYLGREISVIENGFRQAGQHTVEFNAAESGRALSSGIYFYRIHTNSFTEIKKMIFLK